MFHQSSGPQSYWQVMTGCNYELEEMEILDEHILEVSG